MTDFSEMLPTAGYKKKWRCLKRLKDGKMCQIRACIVVNGKSYYTKHSKEAQKEYDREGF